MPRSTNPRMSRAHFRALAQALKASLTRDDCVRAIYDLCRASNPAFDGARFLAACGQPVDLVPVDCDDPRQDDLTPCASDPRCQCGSARACSEGTV